LEVSEISLYKKRRAQRVPVEKPSEIRLDQDGIQKED
jgi:hypothetical protein